MPAKTNKDAHTAEWEAGEAGRIASALLGDLLPAAEASLVRLWTLGPGDLCVRCAMASECPERTSCLHLVASAGAPPRTDGPFRRFPLGARDVGRVARERAPYVANDDLDARGLAEPHWLALQRVRGFAAVLLEWDGALVGVLALLRFARSMILPKSGAKMRTGTWAKSAN